MRFGTGLALVALALNLAFTFGHHHFGETAAHATGHSEQHGDGETDHDSSPAHPCFACIVMTAVAVAASPPSLPARMLTQGVAIAPVASFQLHASRRASFDARAPPRC
jgi:hypothetical protein